MKRAEPTAVADRGRGPAPAADVTALYDVVLLAGSPRRLVLRLPLGLSVEELIDVDGVQWMVADVRTRDHGPVQLICIHPD